MEAEQEFVKTYFICQAPARDKNYFEIIDFVDPGIGHQVIHPSYTHCSIFSCDLCTPMLIRLGNFLIYDFWTPRPPPMNEYKDLMCKT